MDYQLQEGRFTLPDTFEDRTVNMFVTGANGPHALSITVSRDTALPDEDLGTYLQRQLKLMGTKLRAYTVLDKQVTALGANPPLHGVQVDATHQLDGRPLYQRQAAFIIAPSRVLVISTSSQREFTAPQTEEWQALLASFQLAQPFSTQE